MKSIFLMLFLLSPTVNIAQVVIDPTVAKSFNTVFEKLTAEYKQAVNKPDKFYSATSFAIFTVYDVDTLNKTDLRYTASKGGKIHIYSTDTDKATGKLVMHEDLYNNKNENIYMPVPFATHLKSDTLVLTIPDLFFPGISHKIFNGKVSIHYLEYSKNDKVFTLRLNRRKADRLSVSAKVLNFKLSTSVFKPGIDIYGEAEFISDPYYVDDSGFKSGYIKKRLHCKYVFKLNIINKPN